jgi:hypothetical protein
MSATVKRGRKYQGEEAFEVVNPDGHRFVPGQAVLLIPPHEEAPAWRAILAGYQADGRPVIVPLQGHFGDLIVKTVNAGGGLSLSSNGPKAPTAYSGGDEVNWNQARTLALSTAFAFGLESRA